MLQTYCNTREQSITTKRDSLLVRSSVALPPVKRAQPLSQTQESVKSTQTKTEYCRYAAYLLNIEERTAFCAIRLQECIRTADARRIVRGSENSASASLLIYSNYALQKCSPLNVRHMQRPADACNKIGTHRGYSRICSKLSRTATENQDKFQFLSANMIALIGTVLYNAIKEYHDDRTRKTIYFHSHTIENNYNAICKK
ncbi:hypothetical protein HBI84_161350 [Parastagonospora nodorum]|nr:hypothetical protein HBI84_161350 [Parastagonospora nodorum]